MSKPKPDAGISRRLADARASAGLTREQLAEQTGTTADVVGNWERCVSNPNSGTLARVSEALRVRHMWLLTGEGSMIGEDFTVSCPHCGGELALQVAVRRKPPR